MQSPFRILVGLQGIRIMGELVTPETGLLIDHQPFQLVQLSGDAVGMINAALFPQGALNLPGQHQGQQQQQDQGKQHSDNQNLPELV